MFINLFLLGHQPNNWRENPPGGVKWPAERPRAGITQMTYGNAFELNWWWSFATFEPWDRRPSIISVRGSTSAQKLPSKRTFHKFITGYHLSFSQIYNDLLQVEKRGAFQSFAFFYDGVWTLRGENDLWGSGWGENWVRKPTGRGWSLSRFWCWWKVSAKKVREWLSLISDPRLITMRVNWETRFWVISTGCDDGNEYANTCNRFGTLSCFQRN